MAQPQHEPQDGLTRLPLFPLNLVLFPGMDLPLHIFEERYRNMIGECLENDTPFGVVLIKEGPEGGAPGDNCAELLPQINEEYVELVRNLTALTGGYTSRVDIPVDPIELSYSIAASLEMESHLRQSLLVTETAATRLYDLIPLLQQGNEALRESIRKQNPFQGPRLN